MIWFKGCPRCGGDLILERIDDVDYFQCLQCSRSLNDQQKTVLLARRRYQQLRKEGRNVVSL